jgi:Protein of unknown function (DUF2798)
MHDGTRPDRRKLPAACARWLAPLLISILMSAIVSAVATLMNTGPGTAFMLSWPRAWGTSWAVAFPALLVILPFVRRIVAAMVQPPG